MRYDDALSALVTAPRLTWPVQPEMWAIAPGLHAATPVEPVTIEHAFRDETLTLTGPLAPDLAHHASRTLLSIDGDEAVLWAEDYLLRTLLELAGHVDDPARYSADTHALIIDHLARPLLEALATVLEATTVEVLDHGAAGGDRPDDGALAMAVSVSGRAETRLVLSAPDDTLGRFTTLLAPQERHGTKPPAKIRTAGIGFVCTLLAPEFEIDGEDLASLQENDVVVLDAQWLEAETFRLCVAEALVATVFRDGDALHLRSEFEPFRRNDTMARDPGTFSTLPVTVCIELARKSLSLEELEGAGVGDVLDFADASLDTVSLTANGREVGKGVLVRSGDQVGIRLTSVA